LFFSLGLLFLVVEELQQHCFIEKCGFYLFIFMFKFLSSMVEELQQPYFIENVGSVGEDVTSTTPN